MDGKSGVKEMSMGPPGTREMNMIKPPEKDMLRSEVGDEVKCCGVVT